MYTYAMKTQKTIIAALFCLTLFACATSQTAGKANPFFFSKYGKTIRPPQVNKSTADAKLELSFALVDSKNTALAKLVHSVMYNGLTPKQYADKIIESSKQDYLKDVEGMEINPEWIYMFQREYKEQHHVDITGSYAVISRSIYEYLGGAHGYTGISCHVFDMDTLEHLSLNDIITGTGFSRLMPLVMTELRLYSERETGRRMGPNDRLSSGGLYQTDTIELQQWFPAEEGLCFFWNPYEIASYADGHIFVTVSWNNLQGILSARGETLAKTYR